MGSNSVGGPSYPALIRNVVFCFAQIEFMANRFKLPIVNNDKRCASTLIFLRAIWPRIIELWIASILVIFFVVRVLGSQSARRIFQSFAHHRIL